jgi:hemoglobin/transferrin/lactoferrin receptor protein
MRGYWSTLMLTRTLLLALAAICCASPVAAQDLPPHSRRGIVVDESGSAISGARFVVRSTQGAAVQQATTDADGTFLVDPLPAGSYWLEVVAPHFDPRRLQLQLEVQRPEPAPLRVVLSLAPFQSDVTVTAQPGMIADIDRTAPLVTVRDSDEFRGRPLATLGSALEGVTGVMVQQSTVGQASPFLRGLTGYQVLNLIDGVRFSNSTFRSGPNQYLAFVDPSQVERLEVMLGPASGQFGSDALGGAIQLLTPALRFSDAVGPPANVEANVVAASADRSSGVDATLFLRGQSVSWSGGGGRREPGDLRAGGGRDSHHVLRRFFGLSDDQIQDITGSRQSGTGFTQTSMHTKVAVKLGRQQSLTGSYQRSEQDGVRGYKDLWGGLGRLRSDFEPQRQQFMYGRYEALGAGRLDWLGATVSLNSQDDGSVRQNLRPTDRIVRDDVGVDARGYAVQAGVHLGNRHAVVFGGEIYDERVAARRDETDPRTGLVEQKRPLYPNGSGYRTSGIFVQDVVDLLRGTSGRALVAHVGGRFTRVDVTTDADKNRSDSGQSFGVVDSRRDYHDWTYNASLTWQAAPALAFNVVTGRGFRAPNLNDLGALGLNDLGYEVPAEAAIETGGLIGASDGEGAASAGRPVDSLRSERLFNLELGTTLTTRRAYVRVHGFDAELLDPIVRRTLVFPLASLPSALAGIPVTAVAPTATQLAQGVGSVATAFDPRAVKAFVNEGRARYYGLDAVVRYRLSTRWFADANYSYLVGHDLNPTRFVRRLPPQQGFIAVRFQPNTRVSWIEASASMSGAQERLSGGDITDERIGAARRRSDITDFFQGGLIAPYLLPGGDGRLGTSDDLFGPTGETVAQLRDRVLPLGETINGVRIADDGTRAPLYTRTPGFVSLNVRAGLVITDHLDITLALMNAFDRNYRVHGSGVDAPGRSLFARLILKY